MYSSFNVFSVIIASKLAQKVLLTNLFYCIYLYYICSMRRYFWFLKTDDNSSQKYQLYAYVCHAKDIKAKGVSGHLGNIVPLLHWMNRVKLKVDDVGVYR